MTDTILCIDIGTSSLKAAFLPDNLSKGKFFVSRQAFPESAFVNHDSAKYYLPALKTAISELKEKCPDYAVEAVCISGNGPTVISEDGITFLYSEVLPEEFNSKTSGLSKTKSLFIPRFKAFKKLYAGKWNNSAHILGAPEYLLYQLAGAFVSILPEERFAPAYWNEEELAACGFTPSEIKKIPPFVKAGAFAGKVTEKAALETGLFEGTFVFAGSPDFVTALIGTGTVLPGRLCDRAGTSEGLNLCTSKPVFAEGLRTMPSVVPGLWNLSYLVNGKLTTDYTDGTDSKIEKNLCLSAPSASYFYELSHGVTLLREAALANGEYFPDYMTITGGQALNDELIAQKEKACGLKIKKMPCNDAELIGDLILARVALGDYDDITEAVFAILGV